MSEVIEIRTPEDFEKFQKLCKSEVAVNAKLMNDIDMSNYKIVLPYSLRGTFDGQDYTIIKNIYEALFRDVTETGTIKNLTVEGDKGYRVSFCDTNLGTVENCVNKTNIINNPCFCHTLGSTGKLINCRNEGKIKKDVFYNAFASLDFDTNKLQFVDRIHKGAVYKNNIAAGSFETKSGCAVPVVVLVNSILDYSDFLSEDKIKKILESEPFCEDKNGCTWLHQFVDQIKKKGFYYFVDPFGDNEGEKYVSSIIKNIALHTDIDFAAKDKDGKTAIDYLYQDNGKFIPKTGYIKNLISNIIKEQQKAKISNEQEINNWGIER